MITIKATVMLSSVRTGRKETHTRLLSPVVEWLLEGAEV